MTTAFNTRRLPLSLTPDLRARLGAPCKTWHSHPPLPNIPVCTSPPGRAAGPPIVLLPYTLTWWGGGDMLCVIGHNKCEAVICEGPLGCSSGGFSLKWSQLSCDWQGRCFLILLLLLPPSHCLCPGVSGVSRCVCIPVTQVSDTFRSFTSFKVPRQ